LEKQALDVSPEELSLRETHDFLRRHQFFESNFKIASHKSRRWMWSFTLQNLNLIRVMICHS